MKLNTEIVTAWSVLNDALGLAHPVQTEAEYTRLAEFAESLAETLPDDANNPLWGLVSLISDRLRDYETRVHPWPDLPPHELLRELMKEHGLKQADLPEVGTQSVISEIISGKRALNMRQARALAKRFAVPIGVFAA
ncbi:MAG: helix-turn-helix domain-containing protein [Candidatus Accumulibacter sp.]|nr:helix-turn-helix domain-containing protein [Accumulibacter sp.]